MERYGRIAAGRAPREKCSGAAAGPLNERGSPDTTGQARIAKPERPARLTRSKGLCSLFEAGCVARRGNTDQEPKENALEIASARFHGHPTVGKTKQNETRRKNKSEATKRRAPKSGHPPLITDVLEACPGQAGW